MNSIDLRTGYFLTGFADFESAFAASEVLCGKGFKVAYLNEASQIQEREVISYTRSFESADTKQYQNYHYSRTEHAKTAATESLNTALEVLNEKNGFKAKFIMVVAPKKVKAKNFEQILQ